LLRCGVSRTSCDFDSAPGQWQTCSGMKILIAPLKTGQPQAPKPRVLPPAFRAHMFKPGQTGNPGGFSADIAAVRRLARENSIEAMQQILTLMRTAKDERVRLVAADKVLERAWGRPKEEDPKDRPPMAV
jgi:hypothetical protein